MCRWPVSISSSASREHCNEPGHRHQNGSDAESESLHLPTIRQCYEEVARQAEREQLSYERYLHELVQRECEDRQENRTTKMLRESQLPLEKSLEAFDTRRLPPKAARQMRTLLDAGFLERTENVLVFGNPGSGKTHMLQAAGQELVRRGHRMLFTTCEMLVQELLIAKRDLKLSRLIKKYSRYEGMIIDDLGYIRQTGEEMEVVFTLLAERYERGSVLLTSNLPFSKWDGIFKDPMTTAAAIDRLVHHSIIVELNIPSYRLEQAKAMRNRWDARRRSRRPPATVESPVNVAQQ
jgi:DNA replication protein DnaC